MVIAELGLIREPVMRDTALTPTDMRVGTLVHQVAEAGKLAEGSDMHADLINKLGKELAETPGALDVLKRIQS